MSTLRYKTRGDSSPDRKQKVYFCAHHDDYAYLDDIAHDILACQNCAVWYDAEPQAEYDEQELDARLAEMQLFVLPVTTQLLTSPSRALEHDLEVARREHIPILPLMQESRLDALFSEKIGDLQYLDKHKNDPTGISYEEKLEKFLRSVLVGDEEAQKIRSAFAAYIFLSYRKKDREYAQKLMRLIHKIDFCRDVAIWYDEFLTPGEDFGRLIADSLEKSHLFVLAVTPSLLEDKNYVMRVEYPMACRSHKPILPAELVHTERGELGKMYDSLPRCVDAYDRIALYGALREHFSDLAEKQNDSPEQLYLMGLAYLSGVDVERDSERALGLITDAAEKGYTEAVKKLVQMYRDGLGVESNYEKAVEWQEKLVRIAKEEYDRSGSEDAAKDMCYEMQTLGDFIYELRLIDEAYEVFKQLHELSGALLEKFPELWLRRVYASCYTYFGIFERAKGHPEKSLEHYMENYRIASENHEKEQTSSTLRSLSISSNRLGDILVVLGRSAEALEYYRRSLEIRTQLAEETGSNMHRGDLALGCQRMGDMCRSSGNVSGAYEYYEKCLEIRQALAQETGDTSALRNLSLIYGKLAALYLDDEKAQQALDYYQKALEIDLELDEKGSTITSQRDISYEYSCLSTVYRFIGDLEKAREYTLLSLEIDLELARRTGLIISRRDVAVDYNKLSSIYINEENYEKAIEYCEKELEISLEILSESQTLQARRDVSTIYQRLGDIYRTLNRTALARENYFKDLEISLALSEEDDGLRAQRDLSVSYDRIGRLYMDEGDYEQARHYFTLAYEIDKKKAAVSQTIQAQTDLSASSSRLGDLCSRQGDDDSALEYYTAALEINLELMRKHGRTHAVRNIEVYYEKIGNLHYRREDYEKALECFRSSLEIALDILEKEGTVQARRDLGITYCMLGNIYSKLGMTEQMRESFEKNLELCEQVVRVSSIPEDLDNLAVAYVKVYNLSGSQGAAMLRRAYDIWCRLSEEFPDIERYRKNRDIVKPYIS